MSSEPRWEAAQVAIRQGLATSALRLGVENPEAWIEVMEPTEEGHGDLTSNAAFRLTKTLKQSPATIARRLIDHWPELPMIERVEVAGPGFINFWLDTHWLADVLPQAVAEADAYGCRQSRGERVLIEFVSANPTGPLVVVNGRAAALGDSLARILQANGYAVDREFYVNDAGQQLAKLGQAMAIRLRELAGEPLPDPWPEGVYPGAYVRDLAEQYRELTPDWAEHALHPERREALGAFCAERLRRQQEQELERFGVHFDRWFSERALREAGAPERMVAELEARGVLYRQDGAVWFRSEQFGDQKDYVVVKSDGEFTYVVPDAAYHTHKFERGYDIIIDLLGPDHHGYKRRMQAMMKALGLFGERLEIQIIQLVRLLRGGQVVRMSKRGGDFVTLAELIEEVGVDPARWFFLERSADTPMDFDLDLAQMKTQDNPVYYVQYAGARIHSVLRGYRGLAAKDPENVDPAEYREPLEQALIRDVARFPAVLRRAGEQRAPQVIVRYLSEIAGHFHAFYRQHRILEEQPSVRRARIELIRAVLVVIGQGMGAIGVSVPERM